MIVTDYDDLIYNKKESADKEKIYFIYKIEKVDSIVDALHINDLTMTIQGILDHNIENSNIDGVFNINDPPEVKLKEDSPIEFNIPIHGTINQYKYGNDGKSACTIIAIQAAISLLKQENLNRPLLEEMIDVSIEEGVVIYNKEVKGNLPPGVQHTGLSTGLNIFEQYINFKVNFELGDELIFFEADLPFNQGFFNNNLENDNAMIIICQAETISITKKENIYYYFDSHPKAGFNENGVIIPFDKLETLIDFLNNQRFIKTDGVVILYNTINYTTFTLK